MKVESDPIYKSIYYSNLSANFKNQTVRLHCRHREDIQFSQKQFFCFEKQCKTSFYMRVEKSKYIFGSKFALTRLCNRTDSCCAITRKIVLLAYIKRSSHWMFFSSSIQTCAATIIYAIYLILHFVARIFFSHSASRRIKVAWNQSQVTRTCWAFFFELCKRIHTQ